MRHLFPIFFLALGLAGCSDSLDVDELTGSSTATATSSATSTMTATSAATSADEASSDTTSQQTTLYQRLGEETGIRVVVNDAVGRIVADPKINGYFLNAQVSAARLSDCLVKQIANVAGGPQVYDCRTMKESHAGMGISQADFNDLAAHFVGALTDAGVAQTDIDAVAGVLVSLAPDIVEDPNNDKTVYQRVGRKPAILQVIADFVQVVVADTAINGFFTTANAERLTTCLVRQVCSIDGPCDYGAEVDAPTIEPGVSIDQPCRDMLSSHANLKSTAGASITTAEFTQLAADLIGAMTRAGVTSDDQRVILGVLGSMCRDIVTDDEMCP